MASNSSGTYQRFTSIEALKAWLPTHPSRVADEDTSQFDSYVSTEDVQYSFSLDKTDGWNLVHVWAKRGTRDFGDEVSLQGAKWVLVERDSASLKLAAIPADCKAGSKTHTEVRSDGVGTADQ